MKGKIILILFSLIFICSCTQNNFTSKKNLTQLTLSSATGYLAYQWSDADIFTTIAGSSIGYLMGSYLGEFLEQNDYYYYQKELINTLNLNEIGSSGYWNNNKSGNEGVIIVKNYFQVPECRLIEHIYVVKKNPKKYFDTACRSENGSWNVIR
jgi:surface antigen